MWGTQLFWQGEKKQPQSYMTHGVTQGHENSSAQVIDGSKGLSSLFSGQILRLLAALAAQDDKH